MTGGFPAGFQWDEEKNRTNIREHKIAFQDAVRIFERPTLDEIDDRFPYGEERINSLGELDGRVILNVTHTERNGDIRLISARLATDRERTLYREFVRDLAMDTSRKPFENHAQGRQLKRDGDN